MYGVYNDNSEAVYTVNATLNWWGNESGPYHQTQNPSGSGDNITDNVDFIPWFRRSIYNVNNSKYYETIQEALEEADDYDTVSGYILNKLGRFPKEKEEIDEGKFVIEVTDVEGEPGWYRVGLKVQPHFKYMGASFTLSLVGKLDKA